MERAEWVEDVLSLSVKKRIKTIKYRKNSAIYKRLSQKQKRQRRQRKFLSANEIIQICNKYKLGTLKQIRQYNKTHKPIITKSNIEHWFGLFSTLKKRLQFTNPKQKFNERQVIDLCVRFNILTAEDYNYAHFKQPSLFPSYKWVIQHFGQWKFFKRMLQACNAQFVLNKYIRKKIQLGRYPSKSQCKRCDIDLDFLLKIWTPQQLRQTIELLQDAYK